MTSHATPIQAIVPAMPARFSCSGQSGRVPRSLIVPKINHNEISGAARRSIADSEL